MKLNMNIKKLLISLVCFSTISLAMTDEEKSNIEALRHAIGRDDSDTIKQIIQKHPHLIEANVAFRLQHFVNQPQATPLLEAAVQGKFEAFKTLLELGANPFAVTHIGNTILHKAINGDNEELIRFIYMNYSQLQKQPNNEGHDPFLLAMAFGKPTLAKIALRSGNMPLYAAFNFFTLHTLLENSRYTSKQITGQLKKVADSPIELPIDIDFAAWLLFAEPSLEVEIINEARKYQDKFREHYPNVQIVPFEQQIKEQAAAYKNDQVNAAQLQTTFTEMLEQDQQHRLLPDLIAIVAAYLMQPGLKG